MRRLIWILFFAPLLVAAQANYAHLNMNNVKLVVRKGDTLDLKPISLLLVKNKTNRNNILFQSDELKLTGTFEVSP